ncbi:hypothetical protein O6P43_027995 [Quillaja saponaria]|uniref:Uncharacterized protein n=1 Tax=Quillaja saponaria TaxID=32244 RepID=A0AAD7L5N5_QUISA|nr:hypothetical protein O6P43_027995 [Quillaja saponaria]
MNFPSSPQQNHGYVGNNDYVRNNRTFDIYIATCSQQNCSNLIVGGFSGLTQPLRLFPCRTETISNNQTLILKTLKLAHHLIVDPDTFGFNK